MRLRSAPAAPPPPPSPQKPPPPSPQEPETDLLAHIDVTARTLLRRIEGGVNMGVQESAILTEQVKAFEAVVRWAGARKDLLPKVDEKKDAKFVGIKSAFRAGATPRSRGGPGSSAPSKDRALSTEADGDDADDED